MLEKIYGLLLNSAGMSYKRMLFALLFTTMLGLYIYIVYRGFARKSFYAQNFNLVLPFIAILTTAIVVAMQANLVVSLGMVGALSIVRFRTALKDPLDLGFIFWAISMGIISGTELYGLAFLTSLIATIILYGLQQIPLREAPHLLIVNGSNLNYEEEIDEILRRLTTHHKVKSRNMRKNSLDIIFEIRTKNGAELIHAVQELEGIDVVSILDHDGSMRH